ncbi:tumor necrosis factor ligand superfamily member 13B isoform X1 [Takifugu rubripes]|uniref:TNF superfamily member 13b n=1 Tax=Takifugu rubripes TaxID=31033 RepID=A0A3B5JW09_TAKRU|nr:tumor necrosis factor ligand superfamily member 13B isoform X1 [Takifugu rubripes]|eukprot:XP_003961760.1 PREDICTED: tumor necrosis factor ligand superfamily member 13B isoform X1 [Takifugu rubripes]
MGPVRVGLEAGSGQRAGEGSPSWPVVLLTLVAISSSFLSAVSLYQLLALRAEVDALRSEVGCTREDGQPAQHASQMANVSSWRSSQEVRGRRPGSPHAFLSLRRQKRLAGTDTLVSQPCLQMLANSSRTTFRKELTSGPHTGIPWKSGLRRGSALEADGDSILVGEEGFYFVYSQVYYMDSIFAMGHVVIRRKRTVVGDETPEVILFRCIQNMNPVYPFNTCYTGGIVKLKRGDHLELLIPRSTASVSLDEDSTFLGAIKLG